jgi:hypothetical protein
MRILAKLAVVALAFAAAPALAADAPAATVGDKAAAKWTETTDKAAATPEQKAALKKGKAATVTGEIIEVSCFLQLGKRGEKHIPCGTKCIQNGQPIGLVDDKGTVYVLFAEAHDPRRDGQIDLKATFLPWLSKRVTVSGMVAEHKGTHALYVDSGALQAAPAAPAAEAPPAPAGAPAPAPAAAPK